MKRVLITGENSYVGKNVAEWLAKEPAKYEVTTISVRGDKWHNHDFSKYDTIFHVAGIAHADTGKISEAEKSLYYQINCDLACEVAKKFKEERIGNVSQFIYMSSIIVYESSASVNQKYIITRDTIPKPTNFYGDSKLQAELRLSKLETNFFLISLVRPPMIYGSGSKGNYQILAKLARKTLFFPDIKNERSMLYIDNLSEFIKLVITNKTSGVLFPQNKEYVGTSDLVRAVAKEQGRKIFFISILNWAIVLLSKSPGKIGDLTNKAFGNMVYDKELSLDQIDNYQLVDFEQSIILGKSELEE